MIASIKHIARNVVLDTFLRPPTVKHCSQTIYEALLGCCRMWEATNDEHWQRRAEALVETLVSIQQPDGGFDIGYDFNFGRMHKKGQSTSPELVGLLALCTYAGIFDKDRVREPAQRAVEWIRTHAQDVGSDTVAIPYSPHTINEIMVYNGTSFACGALGCYLGAFGGDEELHTIYKGMTRYLDQVLSKDGELPGRFWFYNDQSREDLDALRRNKIDYYHQMQQVEVHALAQQACPVDSQRSLIQDAADHIVALRERHAVLPYTNDTRYFKDQIHLWGLSSVIPGMLEAAVVIPERRESYHAAARAILDWILAHGWRGNCFSDVLQKDGTLLGNRPYMVRSDAWVFNALSAAQRHLGEGPWTSIAEVCYETMASKQFSGPESHATCMRRRIFSNVIVLAKNTLQFTRVKMN